MTRWEISNVAAVRIVRALDSAFVGSGTLPDYQELVGILRAENFFDERAVSKLIVKLSEQRDVNLQLWSTNVGMIAAAEALRCRTALRAISDGADALRSFERRAGLTEIPARLPFPPPPTDGEPG